jgi:hypothetical protein
MATYYVRTDGSDTNAGTGSGTGAAWKTIGKALGSAGIASGDTVWIAPGRYREQVTVNMANPTAETFVKGDPTASQFSGVTAGPIILTAYTTNDETNPSNPALITNTRDYLSFSDINFVGYQVGNGDACLRYNYSQYHKYIRCSFESYGQCIRIDNNFGEPLELTFDRCLFRTGEYTIRVYLAASSTGSSYNTNLTVQSCVFINTSAQCYYQSRTTGTVQPVGTGLVFYNNLFVSPNGLYIDYGTQTTNPGKAINNIFCCPSTAIQAQATGQFTENYNRFVLTPTPRSNVATGANSKSGAPGTDYGWIWNQQIKTTIPFFPVDNGVLDGAGTTDSGAAPTTDFYGQTFANPPSIGPVEVGTVTTGGGGGLLVHPGTNGRING